MLPRETDKLLKQTLDNKQIESSYWRIWRSSNSWNSQPKLQLAQVHRCKETFFFIFYVLLVIVVITTSPPDELSQSVASIRYLRIKYQNSLFREILDYKNISSQNRSVLARFKINLFCNWFNWRMKEKKKVRKLAGLQKPNMESPTVTGTARRRGVAVGI